MLTSDSTRFAGSEEWTRRGERSDGWAAARAGSTSADPFARSYPRFVHHAAGAHLWDVDGNRYTDFVLGYGSVVLGHAHPDVTAAVVDQIGRGTCFSPLRSPRQVELTELLVSVIPEAQLSFLLKTGSDATSAAVRLARIHTGRMRVVHWGYHGWHDWSAPRPAGVAQSVLNETSAFVYNDTDSLRELFARYPDDIACVIMMPFEVEAPHPGFLEEIKRITHQHGALFILDEMRSGFRMSLGGAQEYFRLSADLATFSKAMANGYPISAIAGRADIMAGLAKTHISSTCYANPIEMAAAISTISILRDTDALARLWRAGRTLQVRVQDLIAEYDLPAEVVGYPPAPAIRFTGGGQTAVRLKQAFFQETVRRGILIRPNHQWVLSSAHTDEDVDTAVEACRGVFESVLVGNHI